MKTNDLPLKTRQTGPRSISGVNSGDPLRENFYALLVRSYTQAKSQGKGTAVYFGIARSLSAMCAEPWVRRFMFSSEFQLVQRFLRETAMPVINPKQMVQKSIAAHMVARAFASKLGKLGRQEFGEICAVTGKEHLDAALAAGRGVVILHTHTVCGELFWNWLDHQSIERGLTLWQWTWGKNRDEFNDKNVRAIESARELHTAKGILRTGGLVHSMADGQQGQQKLMLPVYNRLRPYVTGFAALAISANALVITGDVFVEADGMISIVIGPPIDIDKLGLANEHQIDSMVREYAKRHEKVWHDRPENIPWIHMLQHLHFPHAA